MNEHAAREAFPTSAGILFGLGLGGFFDGIVLHQILQWHHMLSNWRPPKDLSSLEFNTLWDGLFHSLTWVFVTAGLLVLWRRARLTHFVWSNRLIAGSLLLGWGVFNVVEGLVNHQLLGLHHVNETAPLDQRFAWDMGFLAWGALMAFGGALLLRADRGARDQRT